MGAQFATRLLHDVVPGANKTRLHVPNMQERTRLSARLCRPSTASLLVDIGGVAELLVLGNVLRIGLDLLVDALVCKGE